MVLLDELRVTMSDYQKDMDELYEVLGVAAATERYNALQEEIAKEGFWDDLEHSQKVLQESKTLENRINSYKKMQSELEDIITLIELSLEEGETESTPDMNAECDAFIKKLEEMKLASLLTGEYDHSNAILTFHAGAGGTEAQDWAEMLYRMYNRWAERHHFKVTTLASLCLTGNNNARWQVRQPNRRTGLVDVLTARTAGTEYIHLNIFRTNVYFHVVINFRHDFYCGERSMPSAGGIERRYPNQTMHARF